MRSAVELSPQIDVFPPFSGPASDEEIDRVAKKLGLPITGSYREFTRLLGDEIDSGFAGVNMEHIGGGTLWTTEYMRKQHNLPSNYLVVWDDDGGQVAYVMDCSDPQADGEFPVYRTYPHEWESMTTRVADSFVEYFEHYFALLPATDGRPARLRKKRIVAVPERKLPRNPPVGRMRTAIDKLWEEDPQIPFSGPVPVKEIDRVAKTLGVPITGSYRDFIRLVGNETGGFRGIDTGHKHAGTLRLTQRERRENGLPKHHLVVFVEDEYGAAYVLDTSDPQGDGEFPVYQIFVDDWQGTLTRIADSFVEAYEDLYGVKPKTAKKPAKARKKKAPAKKKISSATTTQKRAKRRKR